MSSSDAMLTFMAVGRLSPQDEQLIATCSHRSDVDDTAAVLTCQKMMKAAQKKLQGGERLKLQWNVGCICVLLDRKREFMYMLVTSSMAFSEKLAFDCLTELQSRLQGLNHKKIAQELEDCLSRCESPARTPFNYAEVLEVEEVQAASNSYDVPADWYNGHLKERYNDALLAQGIEFDCEVTRLRSITWTPLKDNDMRDLVVTCIHQEGFVVCTSMAGEEVCRLVIPSGMYPFGAWLSEQVRVSMSSCSGQRLRLVDAAGTMLWAQMTSIEELQARMKKLCENYESLGQT